MFDLTATILTFTDYYLLFSRTSVPVHQLIKNLVQEFKATSQRDIGNRVEKAFVVKYSKFASNPIKENYLLEKWENYTQRFLKNPLYDLNASEKDNLLKSIGIAVTLQNAKRVDYETLSQLSFLCDYFGALVVLAPEYSTLKHQSYVLKVQMIGIIKDLEENKKSIIDNKN